MSLPYFNLYPRDFEADTSHLSLEEDGAYNRLLRLCWMTPGCSLPDDDAWIMRRMRVDQETYDRVVRVVLAEFFARKSGRVSNARIAREYDQASTSHEKRVLAGKSGGKAKALKTNKTDTSNATAIPKQPEPEPEPIREEDKSSSEVSDCIAHFNATAERVGWPKVQKITGQRKAALSQRIRDVGGPEAWRDAITRAANSTFLTGQSGRGWAADFDWLATAKNFTKLMEGKYDNRQQSGPSRSKSAADDPALRAIAIAAGMH